MKCTYLSINDNDRSHCLTSSMTATVGDRQAEVGVWGDKLDFKFYFSFLGKFSFKKEVEMF